MPRRPTDAIIKSDEMISISSRGKIEEDLKIS